MANDTNHDEDQHHDEEYESMICANCRYFVIDSNKKEFGRCFHGPPTPIVRNQITGGSIKESVKTTRVIVYPGDFCAFFDDDPDDPRRDNASNRGRAY